MMRRIHLVAGASLGAVLIAALAASAPARNRPESPRPSDSDKAPSIHLRTIDGGTFDLSKARGNVVVVNFWATWCGPCVHEIPDFVKMQREYGKRGLVFAGISMDEGEAAVKAFARRRKLNYAVMMNASKAFETYQMLLPRSKRGGIPATFIIDRNGLIRHRIVGMRDRKDFERMILPLLREKSATGASSRGI